jgi:FkbM family methyltransferase
MLAAFFQQFPERLRGKQRVARWVVGLLKDCTKPHLVSARHGLRYHLPNLIENVGFDIFINGVVEGETVEFIATRLAQRTSDTTTSARPVFLDLGANIGGISLPVSRLCGTASVYCVEASPHVFAYLTRNVQENSAAGQITLKHAALSNSSDEYLEFFSPEDMYGKGSLSAVFTRNGVSVKVISLDDFIAEQHLDHVDLIKIDVEGYEAQVFASGAKLLSAQNAPDIVFEYCDWAEKLAHNEESAAQRLLQSFGYRLYTMAMPPISLDEPLREGVTMLFATKKPDSRGAS